MLVGFTIQWKGSYRVSGKRVLSSHYSPQVCSLVQFTQGGTALRCMTYIRKERGRKGRGRKEEGGGREGGRREGGRREGGRRGRKERGREKGGEGIIPTMEPQKLKKKN